MKKLAIGCGVIALVLVVAAGAGLYYVTSKARGYLRQVEALAAVDKRLVNNAAFTPPPRGELDADMVKRFAAVQDSMRARLGSRIDELTVKQDQFLRQQQAERRDASAMEAFTVIKDMMGLILQLKNAQVDALNEQRFSLEEYYWVRQHVYAAAGTNVTDAGLNNLRDLLKDSGTTVPRVQPLGELPARNKELVAPLLPRFKDWAVIASFGF